MKKISFVFVILLLSASAFAQSLGTGSFSGVAYTRVPGGYRFPKHSGNINTDAPTMIFSPNRQYFLVFITTGAADVVGKLVLYKSSNRQVLWSSSGTGAGGCVMQADGNLVIYKMSDERWSPIQDRNPAWSTNTHGKNGAFLAVQNDGNVVIYNSDNSRALWATGTNGR